jgi:valine--pyruvate aminotransferase
LAPGWRHTDECLRITYSQEEEDVRQGICIIAEELRALLV